METSKVSSGSSSMEYRIVKLEKTCAPTGAIGDNWYTYTIERNALTNIVGNRRGTLEQVSEYVREYVADINSRHGNGGYSLWMTRKNNKQPAR